MSKIQTIIFNYIYIEQRYYNVDWPGNIDLCTVISMVLLITSMETSTGLCIKSQGHHQTCGDIIDLWLSAVSGCQLRSFSMSLGFPIDEIDNIPPSLMVALRLYTQLCWCFHRHDESLLARLGGAGWSASIKWPVQHRLYFLRGFTWTGHFIEAFPARGARGRDGAPL